MKNTIYESPMWDWFDLSYSSYLVLPRTLLCGMSVAWQTDMVRLLNEMREVYNCSQIEDDYFVKLRGEGGRFKKDPLGNYKYPGVLPYQEIEVSSGASTEKGEQS